MKLSTTPHIKPTPPKTPILTPRSHGNPIPAHSKLICPHDDNEGPIHYQIEVESILTFDVNDSTTLNVLPSSFCWFRDYLSVF